MSATLLPVPVPPAAIEVGITGVTEPTAPTELVFHRLSVEQYHGMIDRGIIGPRDPVELLEGLLVRKMPEDPVHAGLIDIAADALSRLVPDGWIVRPAHPITMADSEPEPDVVIAKGTRRDYLLRHPRPQDCALVVEISNTSVARDRGFKRALYAAAGVTVYWIVVLPERVVEVYAGPATLGGFDAPRRYADGDSVPVVVDGREVGTIPVAELLP